MSDIIKENMRGKLCPHCYGTIFPGEFHSCPAETSDFTLLRKENDALRAQHVAEMEAKVEALEWRDKEICTLRKQLGASKDTIRMLLSLLPDSHHIDNCWNWCWDELNGDAQDAVKNGRNEANKVLANINRIGGVNDTKPRQ